MGLNFTYEGYRKKHDDVEFCVSQIKDLNCDAGRDESIFRTERLATGIA